MVIYFLLCNTGTLPPPLRDFALPACLTCSLDECFIRDVVVGLARPGTALGVATVTGRVTARDDDTALKSHNRDIKTIYMYTYKTIKKTNLAAIQCGTPTKMSSN